MSEDDLRKLVAETCDRYGRRADALLEVLHDVQGTLGHIPEGAQRAIADGLNIARAEVYGVITFYDDFRDTPDAPIVVRLCKGEACQALGAHVLEAHLAAQHGLSLHGRANGKQLEPVYCLGNCAVGPSATVNGKLAANLTPQSLDALIAETGE